MLTGGFILADPKSKNAKGTDKVSSLINTADVLKKIEVRLSSMYKKSIKLHASFAFALAFQPKM